MQPTVHPFDRALSESGTLNIPAATGMGSADFHSDVPVIAAPAAPEIEPHLPDGVEGAAASSLTARKTVLLVEDEPDLLALLRELFTDEGYATELAADGMQAVRLAHTILPDLIILDWTLPQKSGRDVLADLSSDQRTRGIPVVVVSGRHDPGRQHAAQVKAHVEKPYDIWVLLDLAARLTRGA